MITDLEAPGAGAGTNAAIGLQGYLDELAEVVKRVPRAWVRCELHHLKTTERFVRMEFIELDAQGSQIAKVQGGCFRAVWKRIQAAFGAAGLSLEPGSQVLVQLQGRLDPTFGFQVAVLDIDMRFALGDLNSRMLAIRRRLQDAGVWELNRSLSRPVDFVRVSVIAPPGAASLGDFRSTAARLATSGLMEFEYHEVTFQTRDAPARIVERLRSIYRTSMSEETRSCAVAIVRGGGASADLAWLVDHKLVDAVCRMDPRTVISEASRLGISTKWTSSRDLSAPTKPLWTRPKSRKRRDSSSTSNRRDWSAMDAQALTRSRQGVASLLQSPTPVRLTFAAIERSAGWRVGWLRSRRDRLPRACAFVLDAIEETSAYRRRRALHAITGSELTMQPWRVMREAGLTGSQLPMIRELIEQATEQGTSNRA